MIMILKSVIPSLRSDACLPHTASNHPLRSFGYRLIHYANSRPPPVRDCSLALLAHIRYVAATTTPATHNYVPVLRTQTSLCFARITHYATPVSVLSFAGTPIGFASLHIIKSFALCASHFPS